MVKVYIGIGSNLNDPKRQVEAAIASLSKIPNSDMGCISSLYHTTPLGVKDQPGFINAVAQMDTILEPHLLLSHLQKIEREQGRMRDGTHWGPRIIDLDILLYGNECVSTDDLKIPHPELTNREFVLYPLAEIAPDLALPDGIEIAALRASCPPRGIERIPQNAQ